MKSTNIVKPRMLHEANALAINIEMMKTLKMKTKPARSRDDLITFTVGPNCDGLDESLGARTFGKPGQLGFVKYSTRVGCGLVGLES